MRDEPDYYVRTLAALSFGLLAIHTAPADPVGRFVAYSAAVTSGICAIVWFFKTRRQDF